MTGSLAGGHCVSCVGYDDVQRFWICKNSWGSGFGEGGYFCIAYGECGIDSFMDAVDGIVPFTLNHLLEVKGFAYPISVRNVAESIGLMPPISINELMQRMQEQ